MERFRYGERIQITADHHHLNGRRGWVRVVMGAGSKAIVEIIGGLTETEEAVLEGVRYHDQTILNARDCVRLR